METRVYKTIPQWNFLHQKTTFFSQETEGELDDKLASLVLNYSLERLDSSGFKNAVSGYKATVEFFEDEEGYVVEFENTDGGIIKVVGILLDESGNPCIDHGIGIEG